LILVDSGYQLSAISRQRIADCRRLKAES